MKLLQETKNILLKGCFSHAKLGGIFTEKLDY